MESLLRRLEAYRYKRKMARALALHLRGEARTDGLTPAGATTRLDIEWRARDIHPWDRSRLSPAREGTEVANQYLADAEAAVYRLFDALPQVDAITVRVLDRRSDALVVSGTVSRTDALARNEELSIGMRLRYLGLTYRSTGLRSEEPDRAATSMLA
jgi:hypothetical protein